MSTVNQPQLETTLQADVTALTVNSSTRDILMTAVGVANFSTDRKFFVACSSALPDLYTTSVTDGQIVFVNDIKTPVIASRDQWIGLDGRLLRNDAAVQAVWTWGDNSQGRLGDNSSTTVSKSSPVSVVGGFTNWCQVSAGRCHTAAVRTNGTIWTWGDNSQGRLGDNTTVAKCSPVSVVGGFTDWCQISAGFTQTAAIRTTGTLWTWGCNNQGQLGDNTIVSKSSPVSVVGGFTDWCQVSTAREFTVALRTNGTIWTWGYNSFGRLGDNTTVAKSSPVSVVGGFTDWSQISAVQFHTVALRTNGTIWTWGSGGEGRLGDNSGANKSSPVSVVGGFTDWCGVSAGGAHTAAVRTNGTLWSWGCNNCGQLGHNNTVSRSSPVSVVGGFTDWCQVSAGYQHTAAVRTNGTLWVWGDAGQGRLGDNTVGNKSSPVSISGGFTNWCQVSASSNHTAALRICR